MASVNYLRNYSRFVEIDTVKDKNLVKLDYLQVGIPPFEALVGIEEIRGDRIDKQRFLKHLAQLIGFLAYIVLIGGSIVLVLLVSALVNLLIVDLLIYAAILLCMWGISRLVFGYLNSIVLLKAVGTDGSVKIINDSEYEPGKQKIAEEIDTYYKEKQRKKDGSFLNNPWKVNKSRVIIIGIAGFVLVIVFSLLTFE